MILIDLDTMRADRLGCYGYDSRPTCGRLDSLVKERGFHLFKNAFSSASWTTPATAKFLASRNIDFDTQEQGIPRGYRLFAEMLRTHGYYCAAFTGGGYLRTPGFEQGFHEYRWSRESGKAEDTFVPAASWLESAPIQPFFLFLHTYESHMPYTRDVLCKGLPSGRLGDLTQGEPLIPRASTVCSELTPAESLYMQAAYDGGVRVSCDATADFLLLLDEYDLWKDTVVVILSDHGEEFWDHFPIIRRAWPFAVFGAASGPVHDL